jgi:hypothetical protein
LAEKSHWLKTDRGGLTALASFVLIALERRASTLILAIFVAGVLYTFVSHLVIEGQQQCQGVLALRKERKGGVVMPERPPALARTI